MAKVGDEVVLRGTVTKVGCDRRLVVQGTMSWWLPDSALTCVVPSPVTFKCELGLEHPLTDFPTLQERAKTLGITGYDDIALALFAGICVALKNNGVTPQQFVEGL